MTTSRISSTPSAIGTTSSHVGRRRRESDGPGSGSVASGPSPVRPWLRDVGLPPAYRDVRSPAEARVRSRPPRAGPRAPPPRSCAGERQSPTARTSNDAPSATAASSSPSSASSGAWPCASTSAGDVLDDHRVAGQHVLQEHGDRVGPVQPERRPDVDMRPARAGRHRVAHVLLDPLPGHRARPPRGSRDGPGRRAASPRRGRSSRTGSPRPRRGRPGRPRPG